MMGMRLKIIGNPRSLFPILLLHLIVNQRQSTVVPRLLDLFPRASNVI